MRIDVGAASRPMPGEVENGDCSYHSAHGAHVYFGVVDALGHGPLAAQTAQKAKEQLDRLVPHADGDVGGVIAALHDTLQGTRGVACLLCVVENDTIAACGVGNIAVRRKNTPLSVRSTPGVLGGRLVRPLVVARAAFPWGARLVLTSDGISPGFDVEEGAADVNAFAASVLARFARPGDDATVVVAEARG